ncbi:MAG: ParB/RepB/Spo0J family partition protein [Flavobacteriales bacterium]|nr:ParB/RepB/Spo0J family partition protein [Flavobacteriales bacterium]
MSKQKKSALGRGLGALLASSETDITSKYENKKFSEAVGSIAMVAIERIEANPFQPRQHFEKQALVELTNSIKEHGIIQPITVRKLGNDKYQLISGERRFKASQIAGLKEVPVYIRIANDQEMLEMALIENIQRQNLDAIEIAIGYQRLIEECKLTQDQLGERVGKDRSTVTNYLRLLRLPPEIQLAIREKKITMGHARAIVSLSDEKDQVSLFNEVVDNDMSVRKTESRAKDIIQGRVIPSEEPVKKGTNPASQLSMPQQKIKEDLATRLNTVVDIKKTPKGSGRIIIDFKSDKDLERIIELLDI